MPLDEMLAILAQRIERRIDRSRRRIQIVRELEFGASFRRVHKHVEDSIHGLTFLTRRPIGTLGRRIVAVI